jgi:hypothetical protein
VTGDPPIKAAAAVAGAISAAFVVVPPGISLRVALGVWVVLTIVFVAIEVEHSHPSEPSRSFVPPTPRTEYIRERPQHVVVEVRVTGDRPARAWHPETGEIIDADVRVIGPGGDAD